VRHKLLLFKFLSFLIFVFIVGLVAGNAGAQEPVCPPGFDWRRMTGVGCVQSNCLVITHAKLSYTSACICQDGYKACTEPVDYDTFDGSLCGPNCPASTLVACVPPDAPCPSEEIQSTPAPTESAGDENEGAASEIDDSSTDNDDTSSDDNDSSSDDDDSSSRQDSDFDDFIRRLEEFITGTRHPSDGSEGQEAAGAVTATGLLTAWVLINILSGSDISNALGQILGGGGAPDLGGIQAAQTPGVPGIGTSADLSGTAPAQPPGSVKDQAGAQAGGSANLPQDKWVEALNDKFQQTVKDAVKDGWYVRNPTFIHKIWNNFPVTSTLIESVRGLKGGQCGEMADNGQKWIQKWAEQTYGPGVVVDQIWIGESSSRYPDGFTGAADALYQDNHTATRILLPNGDSYVIDYWDGIIQYRDDGDAALQNIKPVPEHEWINKWRDAIETTNDPADICNINAVQESLRSHISSFDARHPSLAAAGSPESYIENQRVVEQAIQDWSNSNPNLSPELKNTIIANWRKNGGMWGRFRPDPPLDPASAVAEAIVNVQTGN
jgi:hypothetical protein